MANVYTKDILIMQGYWNAVVGGLSDNRINVVGNLH